MNQLRYYIYLTINKINNMKYIGRRSCQCEIEDDVYLGSGTFIKQAVERYGPSNFEKIILCECSTEEEQVRKEIEAIRAVDAVNNREYYNIAPGGLSRPDGFVMSDSEIRKMEYLKNMMDSEVLYAAKIEDNKETMKDGFLPKIMLIRVSNGGDGVAIYHQYAISDDTKWKNKGYEFITVSNQISNKRWRGIENWLRSIRFMPISENDFNGYRNEATKGSKSFKAVSELITQKHSEYFKEVNKYYQEKTVDKATSIKSDILSRYKGAKKDALNCIVKLAETSKDYHNVLDLVCEYDDLGLAEIYYALTGCGSIKVKNIRDGQLKCPDEQKIRVSKILDFERRFSDLQIKGRRDYFNAALAFCFKCNKIDKELLFEKIKKRYRHMKPMQSIEQSLWEIEKVYNYRNSSKVSITSMYLDSKH